MSTHMDRDIFVVKQKQARKEMLEKLYKDNPEKYYKMLIEDVLHKIDQGCSTDEIRSELPDLLEGKFSEIKIPNKFLSKEKFMKAMENNNPLAIYDLLSKKAYSKNVFESLVNYQTSLPSNIIHSVVAKIIFNQFHEHTRNEDDKKYFKQKRLLCKKMLLELTPMECVFFIEMACKGDWTKPDQIPSNVILYIMLMLYRMEDRDNKRSREIAKTRIEKMDNSILMHLHETDESDEIHGGGGGGGGDVDKMISEEHAEGLSLVELKRRLQLSFTSESYTNMLADNISKQPVKLQLRFLERRAAELENPIPFGAPLYDTTGVTACIEYLRDSSHVNVHKKLRPKSSWLRILNAIIKDNPPFKKNGQVINLFEKFLKWFWTQILQQPEADCILDTKPQPYNEEHRVYISK